LVKLPSHPGTASNYSSRRAENLPDFATFVPLTVANSMTTRETPVVLFSIACSRAKQSTDWISPSFLRQL